MIAIKFILLFIIAIALCIVLVYGLGFLIKAVVKASMDFKRMVDDYINGETTNEK